MEDELHWLRDTISQTTDLVQVTRKWHRERRRVRRKESLSILAEFQKWLETTGRNVLPKSPVGQAIGYVLARWEGLTRYCEDGCLAIDNILSECMIRPCAIDRKNYLFFGSDTYDYYYNEEWQPLEERKNGSANSLNQYVWHPYFIDALAVRYWDSNTDGDYLDTNEGAHYYLHDANFNVTSVVNANGSVLERYAYSPYGQVTFLNPDFTTKSASTIGNTHLFTGRERDPETSLYLNRYRFFIPPLGRWNRRDPGGSVVGPMLSSFTDVSVDTLYRFKPAMNDVDSFAGSALDPFAFYATAQRNGFGEWDPVVDSGYELLSIVVDRGS